ncbi:MAG: two-component sensor histidine kinase [Rhodospirillum sp.]|nr:two-component sensor histidine kinase [Rhodospirillum sp.]
MSVRCLWSRCFWTRSLVGQLIGFMLLALVVSQAISFFIYWDERGEALRHAAKEEFLVRSASVAQLLESTPAVYHPEILRSVATNYTRFWLTRQSPEDVKAWKKEAWYRLAQPLPRYGDPDPATGKVPERQASADDVSLVTTAQASEFGAWNVVDAEAWSLARTARYVRLDHTYGSGLTVQLRDGTWLNAAFAKPAYGSIWSAQSTVSLGITAVVLTLIAILVAYRVSRPMRRLAVAAEAFGRGEEIARLPEEGPNDIRRTAEAFNRMQERLHRFVKDRTSMLAAIGHDLRTPITSLRLRAEFVADPDERDKILATLDEMQAMTEATLAFAREEATGEPTRVVDLAALAESVCSDLADLDWTVTFAESGKVPYRCRPAAIRRALRNLIENAVRYGGCARVSLALSKDSFEIVTEDDGPGIPEEEFERVFVPFFRLEGSRSRTTGGVGLGLSIARTIVRGHGGDIELTNPRAGGLRAVIRLPQVPTVR